MIFPKKRKVLSKNEIFIKLLRYCSYQERSTHEVRVKLKFYNLKPNEIEEIVDKLTDENFINDSRFSKIYAGSKFRLKKWGILKIKYGLKAKGIDDKTIDQAIKEEIEPTEYMDSLSKLFEKKFQELQSGGHTEHDLRTRLFRYLIGKGFESELISQVMRNQD
ncbi:MAG: regulatory protein RecX [Cytophagaceae bacterium]